MWVWVWLSVWVCTGRLIHGHSTIDDPYLNPKKDAVLTTLRQQDDGQQELSNHLALEVVGGEETARTIAQKYGLHYIRQVFSDPPVFHLHKPLRGSGSLHHHHHRHREHRSNPDVVQLLAGEPGVRWVNQQRALVREKRHTIPLPRHTSYNHRLNTHTSYNHRLNTHTSYNHRLNTHTSYNHRLNTHKPPPPTSKTSKQAYEIKRWLMEEELGLSDNLPSYRDPRRIDTLHFELNGDLNGITKEFKMPSDKKINAVNSLTFNDPFFKDQWYMHNTGQLGRPGWDLNVTGAWRSGFTGRGLTVSILDDGIQTTNAELAANYDPSISYSLVRDGQPESDPSPRLDPPKFSNSHGTYCAGVAAAVANNGVCGVGVAYEARVGGVRIVDGPVTDVQEATALSQHMDKVSVFSASWGPKDDGAHIEGPGRLARKALELGVERGRGGLGTIYVWASGNGGLMEDNGNLDGYASSIYTLTVTAITDLGTSTFYGEPCACILAGVYVGGKHALLDNLDFGRSKMRVVVPELDGHCSQGFQGSSAAAPLMAGVVALTLQANPGLGWRDVQHLVVEAAHPTPAALMEDGWQTNARGKKFHLLQGFGAIDAGKMVEAARSWHNVGPQMTVLLPMFEGERNITPHGWTNVSKEVNASSSLTTIEHVVATITLHHSQRCLLEIYIVSPSGTTSQVLTHRPNDTQTTGLQEWGFTSVHFWGEKPAGVWRVAIRSASGQTGYLMKLDLTIYGS